MSREYAPYMVHKSNHLWCRATVSIFLMNYRKLLAENVQSLMDRTPQLKSRAKLARKCTTPTRKIGASTIGHLLDPDGPNPQLDTIVAIAEAFKLEPWVLLTQDFDPETMTGGTLPPKEDLELARRISALDPKKRELLLDIFSDPVSDEEMESAGWRAGARSSIHEPPAPYKKPPRQLRMRLKER